MSGRGDGTFRKRRTILQWITIIIATAILIAGVIFLGRYLKGNDERGVMNDASTSSTVGSARDAPMPAPVELEEAAQSSGSFDSYGTMVIGFFVVAAVTLLGFGLRRIRRSNDEIRKSLEGVCKDVLDGLGETRRDVRDGLDSTRRELVYVRDQLKIQEETIQILRRSETGIHKLESAFRSWKAENSAELAALSAHGLSRSGSPVEAPRDYDVADERASDLLETLANECIRLPKTEAQIRERLPKDWSVEAYGEGSEFPDGFVVRAGKEHWLMPNTRSWRKFRGKSFFTVFGHDLPQGQIKGVLSIARVRKTSVGYEPSPGGEGTLEIALS
jgi:hypothetical protein